MDSPTPPQGIPAPNLDHHITQAKAMVTQFTTNLVRYGVQDADILHIVREAIKEAKNPA